MVGLFTSLIVALMIPISHSWAQAPTEESTQAIDPVKVKLTIKQAGEAVVKRVEKDTETEFIATVDVNIDTVTTAVLSVALNLSGAADIDDESAVRLIAVWEQDPATGEFKIQGRQTSLRIRLRAAEGDTGIHETRVIKWAASVRRAGKAEVAIDASVSDPTTGGDLGAGGVKGGLQIVAVLSLQQLWQDGGLFMWPLGFSLILGIAFALERLLTLSLARTDTRELIDGIREAFSSGGVSAAREVCSNTRGSVAAVVGEGLVRSGQGVDHVEKAIESAGAVEMSSLERGMVVLSTVTTVAPLLGFLGTVWGMIAAFKAIAEAGDVQPSIVASGISQALITTAAGLVIAIIIQSFNNFLISRIDRLIIDMEETSTEVVDMLITGASTE